jgi:hypothetical protein
VCGTLSKAGTIKEGGNVISYYIMLSKFFKTGDSQSKTELSE